LNIKAKDDKPLFGAVEFMTKKIFQVRGEWSILKKDTKQKLLHYSIADLFGIASKLYNCP